jgi:hypothetical protein
LYGIGFDSDLYNVPVCCVHTYTNHLSTRMFCAVFCIIGLMWFAIRPALAQPWPLASFIVVVVPSVPNDHHSKSTSVCCLRRFLLVPILGFSGPWSKLFEKLVLFIPILCIRYCVLQVNSYPSQLSAHALAVIVIFIFVRCNTVWERQIEIRLFEVRFGIMRERFDTSHWAECSACTVAGLFPSHTTCYRHCPHYISRDRPGRRLQRWLQFCVTVDY